MICRRVYPFLQKSTEGVPFRIFLQKVCTSLQKSYISAERCAPICRNIIFLQFSAEILYFCERCTLSAEIAEILYFCERCTLSAEIAEILNFCRRCAVPLYV
jgi:hypothetical protein